MSLIGFFARRKALTASPDVVEAIRDRRTNFNIGIGVSPQINAAFMQSQSASYAWLYAHQPAVRRTVDYIAHNVAQLGLKLYERNADLERAEVASHPAAETLRYPNPWIPGQQFLFELLADWLVFDNAYVLKLRPNPGGKLTLIKLPPHATAVLGSSYFTADAYRVWRRDGSFFDVSPENVIHFSGYNPEDPRLGVSKLETLRLILAEDTVSQAASTALMKSGLNTPGYITRGIDAPVWSEPARERFMEDFAKAVKEKSGKTPILEEGMEFHEAFVSPKDAQMLDGRRFTKQEVAGLYGMVNCPPESADERTQFYADVLPPICELFSSFLDLSLLGDEFMETDLYFEFDLDEKLQGDERLKALTSASGRPVLLTNEARAMLNKPPVDGGDELVTPMNVILGNNPLPSPQTMPIQDPNAPAQDGSHRAQSLNGNAKAHLLPRRTGIDAVRNAYAAEHTALLVKQFNRQRQIYKSSKKAIDMARWNEELAADLTARIGITMNEQDHDRLELLDRLSERVPELNLAQHSVEWSTLDDGHEALLVDGGGVDGGNGIYFANAGDDVHAVGALAPLIPGAIGCIVIRPDGSRYVARVVPDPLAHQG